MVMKLRFMKLIIALMIFLVIGTSSTLNIFAQDSTLGCIRYCKERFAEGTVEYNNCLNKCIAEIDPPNQGAKRPPGDPIPDSPKPGPRKVRYSYSYKRISNRIKEIGLGGKIPVHTADGDIATCYLNKYGQISAYNKDRKSSAPALGRWRNSGCSEAIDKGFIVRCCIDSEEKRRFEYKYSYGNKSGEDWINPGDIFTIHNKKGGGSGYDVAQCHMNDKGQIKARNHDSASSGKDGAWKNSGWSDAPDGGFVVKCKFK